MSFILVKCRKCRNILLNDMKTPLLSGHNILIDNEFFTRGTEKTHCLDRESSVYLQEELPEWIVEAVNEADWLKGKLHCPKCSLRVGSFNFVSGRKCTCGKFVVPPVHIIRSKVDWSLSCEGT